VGVTLLVVVGAIFWLQMRPPTVTVDAGGVEICSLFYGVSAGPDEIDAVSLEPTLPRVQARTDGFSAAGILRGHFELEGLGHGRLFVDVGASPFVFADPHDSFVFVNYDDPERTRALFEEVTRVLPGHVHP
jgi:hypothetical protein